MVYWMKNNRAKTYCVLEHVPFYIRNVFHSGYTKHVLACHLRICNLVLTFAT